MDVNNPHNLEALVKRATYVSVSVALILILIKFFAWISTSSLSLQASLVDSLLDGAASIINLFAVRQAYRPPDAEHRFGHGKIEAVAGLGQSVLIIVSSLWLVREAFERFLKPQQIESTSLGIGVMIFSILLTLGLVMHQNYVVSKTNSTAISADSIHYRSDLLINGGVIFALLGSRFFNNLYLDPLLSFGISLYILLSAWKIAKESFHILIDHELSLEDRAKIIEIALDHSKVLGCHELKTRSSGSQNFIQLHIEMDGDLSLKEAHVISEEVALTIELAFPNSEVIIHEDAYREEREKDI